MVEGWAGSQIYVFALKKKKDREREREKTKQKPFSVNRARESLTMQTPFLNGEQAILYINKDAAQNT